MDTANASRHDRDLRRGPCGTACTSQTCQDNADSGMHIEVKPVVKTMRDSGMHIEVKPVITTAAPAILPVVKTDRHETSHAVASTAAPMPPGMISRRPVDRELRRAHIVLGCINVRAIAADDNLCTAFGISDTARKTAVPSVRHGPSKAAAHQPSSPGSGPQSWGNGPSLR